MRWLVMMVLVSMVGVGCGDTTSLGDKKSAQEIAAERNETYVDPADASEVIGCEGRTPPGVVHVCNLGQGSELMPCSWGDLKSGVSCVCLTKDFQVEGAKDVYCD